MAEPISRPSAEPTAAQRIESAAVAGNLPVLDAREQRILGVLLEKQRTVPSSYPMTLKALRTGCNQTSSRDPVVDYSEADLQQGVRALRLRDLVRVIHGDVGARTLRYHQLLDQTLGLADDERALLTVLLLRGAQAPGELKTRTDRLHGFPDREAVEACLARMADVGLVQELPRQPGQHDRRWVHLLGEVAAVQQYAAEPVDLEVVLAAGPEARDARVRAAYDAFAAAYATEFADKLADRPFDRWLLERIADLAGPHPIVDVGCGPGHVAAHLAAAGADVTGIDLSPAMIAQGRERYPEVSFRAGDLRDLMRPTSAPAWGAVLAWYALIHLAPSELPTVVAALARVVRPGGWVAIAVHTGSQVRHLDEYLGAQVDLDVVLHDPTQVRAAVTTAGLRVAEWYLRGPVAGETATDRLYVLAQRPQ